MFFKVDHFQGIKGVLNIIPSRQHVVLLIRGVSHDEAVSHQLIEFKKYCGGQVISDSEIGFFDVDSRSKALGDKLPSFECSLMLL